MKNKESGFSLIEMAMVITIMAIISFGTTFAYNSIMNNININKVVRNLTIDMVTAIQECKKRWGNDLTNCDTAAIVEFSSIGESGFNSNGHIRTPWDDFWYIQSGKNSVKVIYRFNNAPDASNLMKDINAKLNAMSNISSAMSKGDPKNNISTGEILSVDYYSK